MRAAAQDLGDAATKIPRHEAVDHGIQGAVRVSQEQAVRERLCYRPPFFCEQLPMRWSLCPTCSPKQCAANSLKLIKAPSCATSILKRTVRIRIARYNGDGGRRKRGRIYGAKCVTKEFIMNALKLAVILQAADPEGHASILKFE